MLILSRPSGSSSHRHTASCADVARRRMLRLTSSSTSAHLTRVDAIKRSDSHPSERSHRLTRTTLHSSPTSMVSPHPPSMAFRVLSASKDCSTSWSASRPTRERMAANSVHVVCKMFVCKITLFILVPCRSGVEATDNGYDDADHCRNPWRPKCADVVFVPVNRQLSFFISILIFWHVCLCRPSDLQWRI